MERRGLGVSSDDVAGVDLERPGDGSRLSIQLLVEVVADPAYRLSREKRGGYGVADRHETQPVVPRHEPGADPAERYRAPNAQAAVPDGKSLKRVLVPAEVELMVGDDVVDPRADDSEDHHGKEEVSDDDVRPSFGAIPPQKYPPRGGDAADDRQGVRANRERADAPRAHRRGRYRSKDAHCSSPCAARARPSAVVLMSRSPCRPPRMSGRMRAEPTMTPSA